MTYHAIAPTLCSELLHSYNIKCVLDMTPADGTFAIEALRHRPGVPYIGMCFSEAHQTQLQERLEAIVFGYMCTEGTTSMMLSALLSSTRKNKNKTGHPSLRKFLW